MNKSNFPTKVVIIVLKLSVSDNNKHYTEKGLVLCQDFTKRQFRYDSIINNIKPLRYWV